MIFYKYHTAMKAEDEISSAFSLCNPQAAFHIFAEFWIAALLVSRKAIQVSDFDFDPGLLGP